MTDTKQFSELPPLPDPAHRGPDGTGSYFDSYTAAQVREAQRAAIEADHATPAAQAESRLDDDGWSLVFEYREALRYYFSNQFIAGDKEESFKDVVNAEKDLLEFIDAITASPAVAQQPSPAPQVAGASEGQQYALIGRYLIEHCVEDDGDGGANVIFRANRHYSTHDKTLAERITRDIERAALTQAKQKDSNEG